MADPARTTFGIPTGAQIDDAKKELGRNAVAAMRRICETHLAGVGADGVPTRGIYYPLDMHRLCSAHDEKQLAELQREEAFWGLRFSAEYWEASKESPADELHSIWRVKEGVSASAALDAAIEGPTITGCKSTCYLAFASAVKSFIGDEKFDLLFNRGGPLALQSSSVSIPVWMKGEHTGAFEEGVWYAFLGVGDRVNDLSFLHFDGQSLNTICTGDQESPRFMGLNGTFLDGTQDEIFTLLYRAYRDHKDVEGLWSDEQTRAEKDLYRQRLTEPLFVYPGRPLVKGLGLAMAVKSMLGETYREFLENLSRYERQNPGVTEDVLGSPFSVGPIQLRIDHELFAGVKRIPAEQVVGFVRARLQSR